MSAAEGSLAPNVTLALLPASTPVGTFVTVATGAALVTVSVVVAVRTVGAAVTCTVMVLGPAGPSPNPRAARSAAGMVGEAPVASSNCPSPSRSQA